MQLLTGYAEVDGARLYYEIAGAGTPLVFIHGKGTAAFLWDAQMEFFARRCQVLRYDLRGYGRSSMPVEGEPYSHHGDLWGLVQSLALPGGVVVGHALGGAIALDFTLTYPAAVRGLVLVDALLGGYEMSQAWTDPWAAVYPPAAQPLLLEHPLFAAGRASPAVAARLVDVLSGYAGWHAAHADPVVGLDPPAIQCLCEVHAPTLVVIGGKDLSDFQVIAGLLANNIPGARRVMVPGAGHMLPLEAPERLNHLLSGFLSRESFY